jgi:hypothetical protein
VPNPHTVTQGATATPITGTVFDDAGKPVPLPLGTQVEFSMMPATRGQPGPNFRSAARILVDNLDANGVSQGRWAYDWATTDVAVPGPYKAKVWVLLPAGWQDYPSDEYLDVIVLAAPGA